MIINLMKYKYDNFQKSGQLLKNITIHEKYIFFEKIIYVPKLIWNRLRYTYFYIF